MSCDVAAGVLWGVGICILILDISIDIDTYVCMCTINDILLRGHFGRPQVLAEDNCSFREI